MRFVMFYHSLVSDWNHGNAHFLRGIARELQERGADVIVYEPRDGWSVANLVAEYGGAPLEAFRSAYPALGSRPYDLDTLDLDEALAGADVVMVHEWNDPALVSAVGAHRRRTGHYRLLFHDTHHRAVTDPQALARFDLRGYDAVLAFGEVLRQIYRERRLCPRAFTWHEAADTRVFYPRAAGGGPRGDLVWIGNWGDDERTAELEEFLIEPARALGLDACVYGVRYPAHALAALTRAGIRYGGWLPNFAAPATFARFRLTVHVPRRAYAHSLPGIPTIRPFEAMACAVPLLSAPWRDAENLFDRGRDHLVAGDGVEMKRLMADLLAAPERARALGRAGFATIAARHTCRHRVDELLRIVATLSRPEPQPRTVPTSPTSAPDAPTTKVQTP